MQNVDHSEKWVNCLEHLRKGYYENNWPQHEWIPTGKRECQHVYTITTDYGKPVWKGEVEPITLLVNADYGMGDTIHFWRFMNEAYKRVSKIILRCDSDLMGLLCLRGAEIVSKDDPLPEFDKVIHMMALPHVLGVKNSDLNGKQYLDPNPHLLAPIKLDMIKSLNFTKIGFCWAGNPFNIRDCWRSIPNKTMADFKWQEHLPGMRFFNLTKTEVCPSLLFLNMNDYMNKWNDTAYLLQAMDLVISVDTSIAHLAAAMGRPTWLLLSDKHTDWRWGEKNSHYSSWYNSMRIFHVQSSWEELLIRICNEIKEPSEPLNRLENNASSLALESI